MSRLVIFKAPYEELRKADISPTFPGGGSSDILCQYLDYADSAPPKVGDRTQEFRGNGHLKASSSRWSPWQVIKVEEYVANTGLEEFSEVLICTCEYAPLPEQENAWREGYAGPVTVENFGGDVEAFEAWQRSQTVTV
jgi:hypothetical protein